MARRISQNCTFALTAGSDRQEKREEENNMGPLTGIKVIELGGIGMSEAQIESLIDDGVVYGPKTA